MSKISELSNGGALLSTDDLIVVRSGGNVRAQLSSLNGIAIGSSTPAAGSFTTGSFSGNVSFADNAKAIFGAGSDLQIYHDSAQSIIADSGTGNFFLRGENIYVQNADGSANYLAGVGNEASLYYIGDKKLATTSTGIDVTGSVTATSANISDDNNYSFGDGTTYIQGSGSADRLKFITAGQEAIRIDSSQNVGIGTSSPSAPLNISATYSSNTTEQFRIQDNTGGKLDFFGHANGNRAIQAYQDNGSTFYGLILQPLGGNVAIGTSTVLDGLNIYASSNTNLRLHNGTTGASTSAGGIIQQAGNEMYVWNYEPSNLIFGTNNAEAMRISGGNVGIGTSSLSFDFEVNRATASATALISSGNNDAALRLYTSNNVGKWRLLASNTTQDLSIANLNSGATAFDTRLTIDSGGNVGISNSSPSSYYASELVVGASDEGGITIASGATTHRGILAFADSTSGDSRYAGYIAYDHNTDAMSFLGKGVGSPIMTLDSSGNLLVSTSDSSQTAGVGLKLRGSSATTPSFDAVFNTASAVASNFHHYNTNATYNGYRFYVQNNGGVANFSANNVNLSDERVKTNIENSGDYLAKICSIPVRLFNYKDEPEGTERNLGVIAQEVEAQAPELVSNQGFGETPEDGVPLKSVYTTDMTYALMKCIQEQQTLIESLTDRIAALENN